MRPGIVPHRQGQIVYEIRTLASFFRRRAVCFALFTRLADVLQSTFRDYRLSMLGHIKARLSTVTVPQALGNSWSSRTMVEFGVSVCGEIPRTGILLELEDHQAQVP